MTLRQEIRKLATEEDYELQDRPNTATFNPRMMDEFRKGVRSVKVGYRPVHDEKPMQITVLSINGDRVFPAGEEATIKALKYSGEPPEPTPSFKPTAFKIWYKHQVGTPIPLYETEVPDGATGLAILEHIYQVMLLLEANRGIPDYANAGGVMYLDAEGIWTDYDPEEWE